MPNYEFKCPEHGIFEVRQPMMAKHEAVCPTCKRPAQRVFSGLQWVWANTAYRPDGSRREDKDYAPVMRNNN